MTVGLVAGDTRYAPNGMGIYANPRFGKPFAQHILDALYPGPTRDPNPSPFPHPGQPVPHPRDFPTGPIYTPHRPPNPNPFPHPGMPPYIPHRPPNPNPFPRFGSPGGLNPMSYAAYLRLIGQY